MFNWIKNFYKKDFAVALTFILVFTVYWFIAKAIKFGIATPFVWSKDIYDTGFSILLVFVIFRTIFIGTKKFQQRIFFKSSFIWFLVKIVWFVSILYSWVVISTEIPKITSKVIYSASDLPMYVIDPCSYYSSEDLFDNKNRRWTEAEEKEALKYWRVSSGAYSFHDKCSTEAREASDDY